MKAMIERISVNSKIHFGKPCITGTRIRVDHVLELLDEGLSFNEIIKDYYPELTTDDIHACIRYAIALDSGEDVHLSMAAA
jgi:uncharacterized protein (DUF433 family)